MMNRLKWQWDENPMLPVLVFLAIGVWSGKQLTHTHLLYGLGILLIANLILYLIRKRNYRIPGWRRSFMAWSLLWSAGAGLSVFREMPLPAQNIVAFSGTITEPGELQENGSRRCLARIALVRNQSNCWEEVNASAILYFRGQTAAGFRSGQNFLANIPLRGIPAPALPGEFDAQKWYKSQGIFWQANIRENQFILLPRKSTFSIRAFAIECRQKTESIFHKYLPKDEDAAMMSALLLGIRRKMDPELKEAYASAGLTHILAVSGMHVALIYGFLSLLLGKLRKLPGGRLVFSLSITGLLWLYALITGLSPSVLRAVTLFSIMQFSDVLRKPSLPVNNLCFASIILLLADNNLVNDLGYQLSFSAVYGILSFQPALSEIWTPKNKITRLILENLSVTLAASLATLPLILFHFHRFPVYFLLSNLLAVPFSNLLIYAGIGLAVLSPIPIIAELVGTILHHAIALLNGFVSFVNNLPFSSLNHIYIPVSVMLLLCFGLVFFQQWLLFRKIQFFNRMLGALLGIMLLLVFPEIQKSPQSENEVYAVHHRKSWALLQVNNRGSAQLNFLVRDKTKLDFLQKGLQLKKLDFQDISSRTIVKGNEQKPDSRILLSGGKSILILNHYLKLHETKTQIQIDILIAGKAGEKSILQSLKYFRFKSIWVDWPEKRVKKWKLQNPDLPKLISFRNERIRQI